MIIITSESSKIVIHLVLEWDHPENLFTFFLCRFERQRHKNIEYLTFSFGLLGFGIVIMIK